MSAPNTESASAPLVVTGGAFGVRIVGAFTPVAVANGNTVALDFGINVLRTTSDGTIAGAVLNLPHANFDGARVSFMTTGAITTVTGNVTSVVVPAITSAAAGSVHTVGWNAAAGVWFPVGI